jgi:hypothetical protein
MCRQKKLLDVTGAQTHTYATICIKTPLMTMKLALHLLLLAAASTSQAQTNCIINANYNQSVNSILESARFDGWSAANYTKMCEKLKMANARVVITGVATVMQNASFAWVQLSLEDMDLPIGPGSGYSVYSMRSSPRADVSVANEMFLKAMNDALDGWTSIDTATKELGVVRAKLKKSLK